MAEALAFARPGDVLVVWRLDRLGRSLPDLVRIVGELEQAGIGFESVTERIETSTAAGRLVFHVFAALAEFERNITRERTIAGLAAARARGRNGGRPGLPPAKVAALQALAADRSKSPGEICKALGISRATFYKYAKGSGLPNQEEKPLFDDLVQSLKEAKAIAHGEAPASRITKR